MAVVKTIQLKEFVKQFKDRKFLMNQMELVYKSVYEACLKSVKPMAERSPVDTGLYASAWETRKINKHEIQFGNTAPYADMVEKGSRPFKPPFQPILEWSARQMKTTPDDPKARRMAWRVVKKIEREGIDPKNVLELGLEEVILPMIKETIEDNVRKFKGK